MKIAMLVSLVLTFAICGPVLAGKNRDARVVFDAKTKAKIDDGAILIPVNVDGLTSLTGARFVFQYEGTVGDVTFEPADLLDTPLLAPIKLDRANNIIDISIATTKRTATSVAKGNVGYLRFDSNSGLSSVKLIQADFVDDSRHKDIFLSEGSMGIDQRTFDDLATDARTIKKTKLFQNYPNPANPTTTLAFDLKEKSTVRLDIYNVDGSLIRTVVNGEYGPNHYEFLWDGRDQRGTSVSSGIYFYRMKAGTFVATKKMILLK